MSTVPKSMLDCCYPVEVFVAQPGGTVGSQHQSLFPTYSQLHHLSKCEMERLLRSRTYLRVDQAFSYGGENWDFAIGRIPPGMRDGYAIAVRAEGDSYLLRGTRLRVVRKSCGVSLGVGITDESLQAQAEVVSNDSATPSSLEKLMLSSLQTEYWNELIVPFARRKECPFPKQLESFSCFLQRLPSKDDLDRLHAGEGLFLSGPIGLYKMNDAGNKWLVFAGSDLIASNVDVTTLVSNGKFVEFLSSELTTTSDNLSRTRGS